MAAPTRMTDRIEQRRGEYFAADEKILALTVANPARTNTIALAAFLGSLIGSRQLLSIGLLPSTALGLLGALAGFLAAALLASATARGQAKTIPPLTNYLALTDQRVAVIRCWPWGTPGPLATSIAFDQVARFHDSKALVTSRLGIDFVDGSQYGADVHGTLAADFAAAGNAWVSGPTAG